MTHHGAPVLEDHCMESSMYGSFGDAVLVHILVHI